MSDSRGFKKVARAEKKLTKKIAKQQNKFSKVSEGLFLKTASGKIPAMFKLCPGCSGRGKIAKNEKQSNVKFASAIEYASYLDVVKCGFCDGKRIIKSAADYCSVDDLKSREDYLANKKNKKREKKLAKAKEKVHKADMKLKEKNFAIDDPEAYKAIKNHNKALKKAKKAHKKAEKAKEKLLKLSDE